MIHHLGLRRTRPTQYIVLQRFLAQKPNAHGLRTTAKMFNITSRERLSETLVRTLFIIIVAKHMGWVHIMATTNTQNPAHPTFVLSAQTSAAKVLQTNASFVVKICKWGMTPTKHPTRHLCLSSPDWPKSLHWITAKAKQAMTYNTYRCASKLPSIVRLWVM